MGQCTRGDRYPQVIQILHNIHKILGYTEWRNFNNIVMKRAMRACEENGRAVADHFVRSYKMVTLGSGSQRNTGDVRLSRYAAYLVVMNGDPKMPVVAMGQEYFAEQTRRQEITDELALMSEDELRLLRRGQMNIYNTQLAVVAQQSGVIEPIDFAIFQDQGPGRHHARRFTNAREEHTAAAARGRTATPSTITTGFV